MENFKPAKIYDAGGELSRRWYIEYFYRHPETKKFIRFKEFVSGRIKTRSGRRQKAQELIVAINQRLQKGFCPFSYQEHRHTNLCKAMDYVMEVKQSYCRLRTYYSYRCLVNKFKKWLSANKYQTLAVCDFTSEMAQQFIDDSKRQFKLSNRTHNDHVMHMRGFFNLLMKREWILYNPFSRIEKLQAEQPEIICFTPSELALMQNTLPLWDYNLYVVACLVFYCFLRPQEMMRMKVKHIQLEQRTILIPGNVSKNKKTEVVQIPLGLIPVLENFDLGYPDDYFIFTNHLQRGTRYAAPTRIAEAWRKYAEEVGIQKTVYALKHTGIGMAIDAGINVRDLQLQIRHSSLEMTQRYLDRFRRRPSEELSRKFPNLSLLAANKTPPVHYKPWGHTYNPDLSKN